MAGIELQYLTVKDASQAYALSESEIRGNIAAGKLKSTPYHGLNSRGLRPKTLIKKTEMDEFMEFKAEEGERIQRERDSA